MTNSLFNQPTILNRGDAEWTQTRHQLHKKLSNFCQLNNLNCTFILSEDLIQTSPNQKIVFIQITDLIPSLDVWQTYNQQCQQSGKQISVITDNIVPWQDLTCIKFFSYPQLMALTFVFDDVLPDHNTPVKLYNCLVQRTESVRLSWFYFLHHLNLLDQGLVSYQFKSQTNYSDTLIGKDLLDFIHNKYELYNLPHFHDAYLNLRDQIPYKNFEEPPDQWDESLLLLQSKYSIVLESYAADDVTDDYAWCFTEKTLRKIQFPNIPLLFVQKNGIHQLQQLGLEFGDHLNLLDRLDWQQRQQEILKIVVNNSIDYNYKDLYNQSLHNRDVLLQWKKQYQKENFFDNFYDWTRTF
jgi:hypothetical protein